jgi:hypothetical protein
MYIQERRYNHASKSHGSLSRNTVSFCLSASGIARVRAR